MHGRQKRCMQGDRATIGDRVTTGEAAEEGELSEAGRGEFAASADLDSICVAGADRSLVLRGCAGCPTLSAFTRFREGSNRESAKGVRQIGHTSSDGGDINGGFVNSDSHVDMATTPTEVTWQKMQRMLTCLLEATEVVRIANSRRQQTTDLLDEAIHVSSAHWARHEALVAAHTRVAARRTELDKLRADVAGAQREVEDKRADVERRRAELKEARHSLRAASTRLVVKYDMLNYKGMVNPTSSEPR
ncbi:unnamed protein product [Closterium sp. NIES-54]